MALAVSRSTLFQSNFTPSKMNADNWPLKICISLNVLAAVIKNTREDCFVVIDPTPLMLETNVYCLTWWPIVKHSTNKVLVLAVSLDLFSLELADNFAASKETTITQLKVFAKPIPQPLPSVLFTKQQPIAPFVTMDFMWPKTKRNVVLWEHFTTELSAQPLSLSLTVLILKLKTNAKSVLITTTWLPMTLSKFVVQMVNTGMTLISSVWIWVRSLWSAYSSTK